MSTLRRLASGNLATMSAMFVNIVVQLALLPVYLKFWDTERYGLWLVLNTATSLLGLVDTTHQDFVGYECMQRPASDLDARSRILSDAIPVIIIMGLVELVLLGGVLASPLAGLLFHAPKSASLVQTFRLSLFGLMVVWAVSQNFAGTIGRVLGSVGHFATGAWWGVIIMVATNGVPALAVALGAGFGGAAAMLGLTIVAIDLLIYRHYFIIMKRQGLAIGRPDIRAGFARYRRALVLSVAAILEFMQQTGFRLVLLPLLGVVRLVQFSTLRTVANVAQQGVGTLVNPTVPELMRFIANRDDDKSTAVLVGMTYATVIIICPGLIVLQLIAQVLFTTWTLHKVPFDGAAFGVLSATVLVFGLSQPSRAIVRGNNLVVAQAGVSLATGVILAATAILTTRTYGVLGAACALLLAEVVRSGSNIVISARWLKRSGLSFPTPAMASAGLFVAMTIATILAMAMAPGIKIILTLTYAPLWAAMNLLFWRLIPPASRALIAGNARGLVDRGLSFRRRGAEKRPAV